MIPKEQQSKQNLASLELPQLDAFRRTAERSARGLNSGPKKRREAPEYILARCAAGIPACYQLSKGYYDDMGLADVILVLYLDPLKKVFDESSFHRKEAARFLAQALRIMAVISTHRKGPFSKALHYGKVAEAYSKECGDLSQQLITLEHLAWLYIYSNQWKQALQTMLQARDLLEQSDVPIPPLVQSNIYAALAYYQALYRQGEEALSSLRLAYETFPPEDDGKGQLAVPPEQDEENLLADFNRSTLILRDGLVQSELGEDEKAFAVLSQAIDPETLTPKVPLCSERVRIQIMNNQILASLKTIERDKEILIPLWLASREGVFALRSELLWKELHLNYELLKIAWKDERIKELRELAWHW